MQTKTINIVKKEFENSLVKLVQNSSIPACILVDIFQKYVYQLQNIADADYEKDIQQEWQMQEEKSKKETKTDNFDKVIDPRE